MKIEQLYTQCLAQGAYYIVSEGEAAIIDPLREVQPYLDLLEQDGAALKYIFETHFHADFVSGHVDLAKKTGAKIVYGPTAEPGFEAMIAKDEQLFTIGKLTVKALHTPGHTLESTTYLLLDEEGKETAIFSGDTLFLGDVGRPDLAQKAASMTQEELAGLLYDSLQNKIMPLRDEVIVYPGHGAGSACGKNMQEETIDTLGNQKLTNYALRQPNKEAFISAVLDGLSAPPAYFGMNVAMNRTGYQAIDEVLQKAGRTLSPQQVEEMIREQDAVVLDTRTAEDFHRGFVPGAVNIGLKGDFAPWVGTVLGDVNQPLILVVEDGTAADAVTRLARVGFDNVLGVLEGGFSAWQAAGKPVEQIDRISAEEFLEKLQPGQPVLDIRKPSEFQNGHLMGAENLPMNDIHAWKTGLADDRTFYVHCAGGYRSMIAASLLKRNGLNNFKEIAGGFGAIKNTGKANISANS